LLIIHYRQIKYAGNFLAGYFRPGHEYAKGIFLFPGVSGKRSSLWIGWISLGRRFSGNTYYRN
jgi:hypothetical protein